MYSYVSKSGHSSAKTPMQAEISIILPAHNGSDTLPRCLDALARVDVTGVKVEVLLIDNASEDDTPLLMAEYAEQNGWRMLSEAQRGKSFALNTAIAQASGALLVFIDDDIVPTEGWLKAYLDAAAGHPAVKVFAGQIRPKWPGPAPGWLQRMTDEGRACGCTAVTRVAGPYPAIDVKGGNMMVRRSALADTRFDTEGGTFDGTATAVGGEDTRFVAALATAPDDIRFVPEACGAHILQPHEITLKALFQRQMRIGRSSATFGQFSAFDKIMTFPAIAAYALVVPVLMLLGQRDHAMKQVFKIATRLGRIGQWVRRG